MIRDIGSFMPAVYLAVLSPYRVLVNKQLAFYDKLLTNIKGVWQVAIRHGFYSVIPVRSGRQRSMFIAMAIKCPLNVHKK